jgi:hypothetical protein
VSAAAIMLDRSPTTLAASGAHRHRRPLGTTPPARRGTIALTGRVAAAILAMIAISAAIVRATAAAATRDWLGYPFSGLPARPDEALAIFLHNTRALLGPLGLLLIAQAAARAPSPARLQGAIRAAGEILLAGVIAANAVLVGVSVGAYGMRMVRAMLPHGVVELAAFSVAIAVYLQGRRRPLPARHVLPATAAGTVLLAAAATLETFVTV